MTTISSVYWPDPGVISWGAGRTSYDSSQIATLNSSGYFWSTDDFEFLASDYGTEAWRRLKMDVDGNLRLYSLDEEKRIWSVSWQAMSHFLNLNLPPTPPFSPVLPSPIIVDLSIVATSGSFPIVFVSRRTSSQE
ncbi:hypothetical protein RHSIM_RhsimUnG0130300 [Rhododendron simsii]|uniref:Uncharacterized protein n=1 Tax=Rhododendron simsii TaxID=118357 RepID=A0A834FV99_RHOSS|nr:hypothetical protein RHSIM_RhsimUnG0130300 [Rhododendron simsii]